MRITEFLLARIAEDEAVAVAAEPHEEWISVGKIEDSGMDTADGEHVARWSPARVLAECEAKRRIVDWVAPVTGTERVPTDRRGVYDRRPVRHVNEDAEGLLRLLAAPYADHPDYDPAWSLTRD